MKSLVNYVGAAPADADFDSDGDVDGADFLTWQRGLGLTGQTNNVNGDADGNGAVNGADLNVWRSNFGPAAAPVAAAVPEPQGMYLLLAAAVSLLTMRRIP